MRVSAMPMIRANEQKVYCKPVVKLNRKSILPVNYSFLLMPRKMLPSSKAMPARNPTKALKMLLRRFIHVDCSLHIS